MASTYENDLRLQEIGTGEQSGTWGTTTNTNLELIGEALSYSATGEAIANASTHTITVADGVADEARCFYLKCTGGGQACTVTLAPNSLSKVWVIENTTSYTLTFSQGSGANVAILAGQVKMIATDGAGSGAAIYDLMQDLAVPDLFVDDDVSLQSDGAIINFGVNAEIQLTHVHDTGLLLTETGGGAPTLQFRDSAISISSSADATLDLAADGDINLTAGVDINIPANVGLTFGNDAEKIEGDGTDLTIAGNNINLTAVADVNIPSGVGLTFATAEKIESDGTDLSITVGSGGDINIPADIGLTFGDDGEKIEGNGTDLTINSSNDLHLTATTDINIPANVGLTFGDDGEKIEGDGTNLAINSSGDVNITATTVDLDGNLEVSGTITLGSGAVISEAELELLDGVTAGTAIASKVVTTDANIDTTGQRNLTITGDFIADGGDAKVRSTSGSTLELTNTTTSLGDNAFVGGLAFRNDDTSGTEPHYAGIKARTDGAGGSQMELEFYADRDKYEADTPHLVLDVNGNLDILTDGATLGFGAGLDVTLTHVHDTGLLLNAASVIQFRDSAINIGSPADGDLDINADDEIELNSTLIDINGAVDMSSTLNVSGVVTVIDGSTSAPSITNAGDSNSGIYFPADDNIGLVVGGSRKLLANSSGVSINNGVLNSDGGITVDNITIDGTEIDLSSGDLTVDVAGNIILDADGGEIPLKDGGAEFGNIYKSSNNLVIQSSISDGDLLFKGNDSDGGGVITALTLDMSDAGTAIFNNKVGIGATPATNTYLHVDVGTNLNLEVENSSSNLRLSALNDARDTNIGMQFASSAFEFLTGNVGINENSPSQKLHVGGNAIITGLTRLGNGTESSPAYQFVDDTNTGMYRSSSDVLGFSTGGTNRLTLGNSAVVFNEGSADVDFRVESNDNAHMIFVDGGSNEVGIGTSDPRSPLHVQTSHTSTDVTAANTNSTLSVGNSGSGDGVYNSIKFAGNQQDMYIMSVNHATQASRRIGFFVGSVAGDATTDERLSILGNGNVGIGDTSPENILHVKGAANTSTTVQIESATSGYSPKILFDGIVGSAADNLLGEVGASWDTHTNKVAAIRFESGSDTTNKDDGLISFWTSDAGSTLDERMRINSSGGLITTPAAGGHAVFNEGSVDADFRVESNGATYALFVDGGNNHVNIMTSSDLGRVFNVSGDAVIQKASSGATATSGSVLVVEDDDNAELSILGGSSSVLALNFGHSGDNDDGKIDYNTTSGSEEMRFFVNASERLAISKDGDITQPGGDYIYSGGGNFNIKHTGGGQSITFDTTPSGGSTAEGVRITADGVLQSIKGAVFNENSADVDFRVESNGNANMLFVDGGNDQVSIGGAVSETTDTLQVTNAGTGAPTNTRFVNTGNDARGVRVDFFKNRASPTNNDPILEMNFLGKDSAGNAENYANINAYIDDVTSGAEDGILRFSTIVGGVNRNRMDLIPNEVVFNQDGQDINFRVEGSGGGGYVNLIKVDAGNDRVGFGCDPGYFAHWLDDRAGEFQFKFEHQGNNSNRYGGIIQSGSDDNSGTNYHLEFLDGDGTNIGSIRSSGGTVTYATFTASHEGIIPNADNDPSSSANAYPYGTLLETISLSYTQKNGSDSERGILYNVRKTTSANSRAVLGVYGSSLNGAPGNYEAVYKDGDTIPSGKAIGDPYRPPQTNMHNILVLGDGHILCNNSGGNIAMGDGIASSSTAGIGCKATANPSMIIGIAQEAITFSGSETKLVAVQFGLQQFTPWS